MYSHVFTNTFLSIVAVAVAAAAAAVAVAVVVAAVVVAVAAAAVAVAVVVVVVETYCLPTFVYVTSRLFPVVHYSFINNLYEGK